MKFFVGQRVRVIEGDFGSIMGKVGRVSRVINELVILVQFERNSYHFRSSELQPELNGLERILEDL